MRHLGDFFLYAFLISVFYFACTEPALGSQISPIKSIKATNHNLQRLSHIESDKLIKNLKLFNQLDRTILHVDFVHNSKDSPKQKVAEGLILSAKLGESHFKRIYISEEATEKWMEYIIRSGDKSEVWFRNNGTKNFILVEADKWNRNFSRTVLFSPIDLMHPDLFSSEYQYDGPEIYGVRSVAHSFIIEPNNRTIYEKDLISSFRVLIDRTYNGIRKIEYIRNKELVNSLEVLGLKKINNIWVISRLVSNFKGQKTTLRVKELRVLETTNLVEFFNPLNQGLETLNEL